MEKWTVLSLVIFCIIVLFWFNNTDDIQWTEWVQHSKEPKCGNGVKVYKRGCTINSILQGTTDVCKYILGDTDVKSVEYSMERCDIKGRYVILERLIPPIQTGPTRDSIPVAEIKIYDKMGLSLVNSFTTATAGVIIPNYTANNLLDGDLDTVSVTHSTRNDFSKSWFKIDLGSDVSIGRVEVYPENDRFQKNVMGSRIRIVNNAEQDVFIGPNITLEETTAMDNKIVINV